MSLREQDPARPASQPPDPAPPDSYPPDQASPTPDPAIHRRLDKKAIFFGGRWGSRRAGGRRRGLEASIWKVEGKQGEARGARWRRELGGDARAPRRREAGREEQSEWGWDAGGGGTRPSARQDMGVRVDKEKISGVIL
jgi:hypothetical protein